MPTYEYVCSDCGTHVEVYQRFSDEPLTVCGVCGGPLRKVFHPAGILFKGSGFYATDSRTSRSKAGAKSGGESAEGKTGDSAKAGDSGKSGESAKSGDTKKKAEAPAGDGTKERSA